MKSIMASIKEHCWTKHHKDVPDLMGRKPNVTLPNEPSLWNVEPPKDETNAQKKISRQYLPY